jgi:DNA-binding protein HU-beta
MSSSNFRSKRSQLQTALDSYLEALEDRLRTTDPEAARAMRANPQVLRAFSDQLADFTDVWAESHPHNPLRIQEAETELVNWIRASSFRRTAAAQPSSALKQAAAISTSGPIGRIQLQQQVAEQAGLNKAQAGRALDAVLNSISDALARGEEVHLTGFGNFVVTQTSARTGRNPRTKEAILIPAGKRPAFRPGARLKAVVSDN